jgi:GntR family transcriptional regulator / MocR family aminotransferase
MHRQIAAALRGAIEAGEIPPGTRLPSTRALAKSLAVSRNTVLTAYEELAADGILTGRTGSGTRVAGSVPVRKLVPVMPNLLSVLRSGHYPLGMASFVDPDGNPLMAVRIV